MNFRLAGDMFQKILYLFLLFPACVCHSQLEYNHSLGASSLTFTKTGYFNFYPCFQYDARLTYAFRDELSVSLTASPAISMLGVGQNGKLISSGLRKEGLRYFPLYLQLNAGHGSSKKSLESTGAFAGIGYAYLGLYEEKEYFKPAITFGIRNIKDFEKGSFSLKCDIIPDVKGENSKQNMYNIGVFYNFGLQD